MALSLEQLRERIYNALAEKWGPDENGNRPYWTVETFPDYVIARGPESKLFRISYTVDEEGEVTLGEPQEVETAYVPVQESAKFLACEAQADPQQDGWSWPVQVMEAGWAGGELTDSNGKVVQQLQHYFPQEFLATLAKSLEGARFGRRHPVDEPDITNPERIAGWYSAGAVEGSGARATLSLLKNETALREKLLAAREASKLDLFGLSLFGFIGFQVGKVDGRDALIARKLARLVSIDLVTEAGAGGGFVEPMRMAAAKDVLAEIAAAQAKEVKTAKVEESKSPKVEGSKTDGSPQNTAEEKKSFSGAQPGNLPAQAGGEKKRTAQAGQLQGGAPMKDRILKVLEALRKKNAGRADELRAEFDALDETQYLEFQAKVSEALAAVEEEQQQKGTEVMTTLELRLCKLTRDEKIADAKLPAQAAVLVREHLDALGRVYTEAEIDTEIKRVKQAFSAFSTIGRVSGEGHVTITRDTLDRVQTAMDQMLGVKEALADKNVRPFRGIREAYMEITGCRDLSRFPEFGFYKTSEVIATSDFPQILKNSMTKRLIQDYAEVGMGGVEKLISEVEVDDFKTQDRVRMGYLGDMPVVAEGAAYLEITKPTDEVINYAVAKRGGFLDITWETIVNDDTGKISQFPNRIARAQRRTLKQFITDFFANNPNYDGDGTAWFVGGHGNLGSVAISSAELTVRATALRKQTEKDSLKRLGLPLQWIMVPVDLEEPARIINANNDGANAWYHRFGADDQKPENIIVNELLADTNDWYGGALPGEAPSLEIAYLRGFRTPQIFIVPVDQRRAITAIDKIQMFGVQVFGGDIVDFRPAFKNVVA